jgi:hypothetical protein
LKTATPKVETLLTFGVRKRQRVMLASSVVVAAAAETTAAPALRLATLRVFVPLDLRLIQPLPWHTADAASVLA